MESNKYDTISSKTSSLQQYLGHTKVIFNSYRLKGAILEQGIFSLYTASFLKI